MKASADSRRSWTQAERWQPLCSCFKEEETGAAITLWPRMCLPLPQKQSADSILGAHYGSLWAGGNAAVVGNRGVQFSVFSLSCANSPLVRDAWASASPINPQWQPGICMSLPSSSFHTSIHLKVCKVRRDGAWEEGVWLLRKVRKNTHFVESKQSFTKIWYKKNNESAIRLQQHLTASFNPCHKLWHY